VVHFFCPNCWSEIPPGAERCAHCGVDVRSLDQRAFYDKLLGALGHPEPETRARAAHILGEIRAAGAVPIIASLMKRTADPFFAAELATALGRIGGADAERSLREALDHPSFLVRRAVVAALERQGEPVGLSAPERVETNGSPPSCEPASPRSLR
jgi:predicted amidophosphoribosyltransferase